MPRCLYRCARCGLEKEYQSDMAKHCGRRVQCPASLADVPPKVHVVLEKSTTGFRCDDCGKCFSRAWCLRRHGDGGCPGRAHDAHQNGHDAANAGRDVNVTNISAQSLVEQQSVALQQNTTINNTTINHYHHCTVRDIAHPDMEHVPDSLMDQLVRDFPGIVATVAKRIYFDPERPQNHCIRRHPEDAPCGNEEVYRVLQHLRRKGIRIWKKYTYDRLVLELLQEIRDIADKHIEGAEIDKSIEEEFDRALERTFGPILGTGRVRPSVAQEIRRMLLEPSAIQVLGKPIIPEVLPDEPAAGTLSRPDAS